MSSSLPCRKSMLCFTVLVPMVCIISAGCSDPQEYVTGVRPDGRPRTDSGLGVTNGNVVQQDSSKGDSH